MVDRRKQVVRVSKSGSLLIADNLEASVALMDDVRNRMGQDRYEALLDLLNELDQIRDQD